MTVTDKVTGMKFAADKVMWIPGNRFRVVSGGKTVAVIPAKRADIELSEEEIRIVHEIF